MAIGAERQVPEDADAPAGGGQLAAARHVPELQLTPGFALVAVRPPEGAGRGQAKAAPVVGQPDDLAGVPREDAGLASRQVPEANRPIRGPDGDLPAVGPDGETGAVGRGRGWADVERRGDLEAGRRVPDLDRPVDAERDDVPALVAEPGAHDEGEMPFIDPELLAGGRIPDPHA